MRRWIGGLLLGIARWIGRLAWPFLALWILSNCMQCSIVAATPQVAQPTTSSSVATSNPLLAALMAMSASNERPSIGVTAAMSRGYAGAFTSEGQTSAAISLQPSSLIELDLRGVDIDLWRWLPHARRTDANYVWPLATTTTRSWGESFRHESVTSPIALFSLLLVSGVCFAVRLTLPQRTVAANPPHSATIRRGAIAMFAFAALFVTWPLIELGRLTSGGAHIARIAGSASFENHGIAFNVTGFSIWLDTTSSSRHMYVARQYGRETRIPIDLCATAVASVDSPPGAELLQSWFVPSAGRTPMPYARVPGLFVVTALMFGGYLLRRRTERRRCNSTCRRCGYDLTGNTSGVCPECGTPIGRRPAVAPAPEAPRPPSRFGIAVWRTIAVASLALFAANIAYAVAIGASRFASLGDAAKLAASASTASLIAIVWLTIAVTLVCALTRRFEPPGYLRYRLIVAANLLFLVAISWPVG